MDLREVGKKIISFAPAIGTAFLGPAGTAGGLAVKAIASAFGMSETEATPENLEAVINADPEAALKLRQADWTFQCQMRALEIKELEMRLSDTASARQRQIEHEKATGKADINIYILAWLIVAGFFTLIAVLMNVELPGTNKEAVAILIGAVSAGFGAVWQYFFGSSKSSWEKTNLMARMGEGKR